MNELRYFVGIDLGQASEFTALAVLERPHVMRYATSTQRRPIYALRHLERFALGTPYPEMFKSIRGFLRTPPLPRSVVVVDKTGVGDPVLDMLRETLQTHVDCLFVPITITAGQVSGDVEGVGWCLPKKQLVSVVQVLLQSRRLHVPRSLPEASMLVKELENFKMKVRISQSEQTLDAWREGEQDDLVFAVALAAWAGEVALPPLYDRPED